MNKSELVAKIAEGAELTKVQAEKALNCFIAATTAALKAGDKIALVGLALLVRLPVQPVPAETHRPANH